MLLTLVTLMLGVTRAVDATSIKFDGCYQNLNESKGVSYRLEGTNLNADCAHFCASAGYILSATKGALCHCTNHQPHPDTILATPFDVMLDGDVQCDTVCPGAAHTTDDGGCEGDVCCGSTAQNAYTVYAVGGIDILQVILKRVKKALSSGNMPWLTEAYTGTCSNDFTQYQISHGQFAKLRLPPRDYQQLSNIDSVETCKQQCIWEGVNCRSFSYSKKGKICLLNEKSSIGADLEPVSEHTVLYDRNCSEKVYLKPTNFRVDMINQDFVVKTHPGVKTPLDNNDFELDLTHSNTGHELKRSYDTTVGSTTVVSTDSGFDLTSSERTSSSQTSSREHTETSSETTDTSFSARFSVSVKTTATADFLFASASVSTGFSSNFGTSVSSSDTTSNSKTSSSSNTQSVREELSRSSSFTSGYNKVMADNKRTTMSYSLNVPALHKGKLTFSKEKRKTIVKLRSTFQLNGYLTFMLNGREIEVHVSRVLKADDRLFATFTTMTFNRPVITAKTLLFDRHGEKVNNVQLVPEWVNGA